MHRIRSGWVRCGGFWGGLSSDEVEVTWDGESSDRRIPAQRPEAAPRTAFGDANRRPQELDSRADHVSDARGDEVLVWSVVAAVAGLTAFLAPAYLAASTSGHKDYGASALPWFAAVTDNLSLVGSMFSLFVAGALLGFAYPPRWRLLSTLTMSLPIVLDAINLVFDVARDPTSQNLWPFEFLLLGFLILPACLGAYLATRLRASFG